MIVSAGFTAPEDGKNGSIHDPYKLSRSCALQWTSSARRLRIPSKANRAALMGHAGERNPLSDKQIPRQQMRI